ncbi:MAG: hypothetical protein AB1489_38680 [Acidobacteriota bacterium]
MVTIKLTKIILSPLLFLFLSTQLSAQGLFYIESWRKGSGKIQERELFVDINTNTPNFQTPIKDSSRKEKYILTASSGIKKIDNKSRIVNINIYLSESGSPPEEKNLLRARMKDPFEDCLGCDPISETLWIIAADPTDGNYLPILTERVVKIENFYCIIKVTKNKLNFEKEPAFDAATIQITLTNNWKCPSI